MVGLPKKIFFAMFENKRFSSGVCKIKNQDSNVFDVEYCSSKSCCHLVFPDDFDKVVFTESVPYNEYVVFSASKDTAIAVLIEKLGAVADSYEKQVSAFSQAIIDAVLSQNGNMDSDVAKAWEKYKSSGFVNRYAVGQFLRRLPLFDAHARKVLINEMEAMPIAVLFSLGIPACEKPNVFESIDFARIVLKNHASKDGFGEDSQHRK